VAGFRRKLQSKVQDLQEYVENLNQKLATAEKARSRLQAELEDAQIEAERVGGL